MALIQCDFYSETLGISTSMTVILPQTTYSQIGMHSRASDQKHKTLLLLHGLSDDHTIWLRRTSIERYVAELGIAVVMPSAQRSFYTDMEQGLNFWSFISEELPAIARSFFPLSDRREDNFVAGLSMGGYGAFKLALNQPDRYQAAASLSGSLDISSVHKLFSDDFKKSFGSMEQAENSSSDLFKLARDVAALGDKAPLLYQCCGTEDFLYEDNIKFRDYARELNLPLTYEEESGTHEWGYWDKQIKRVLEWLPLDLNR
ncbi:esterase [Paenibacillus baekrokdamisoli]|uniref:Esterase n=1 Tax=Paenibacillus baekrokdamisoli TaxID=1712516 RepID=A0A3G9J836_9BACL|nr:alpha/beta hydrolase family protein [Paenibacillus baekrokdamisoli]MBB3070607.1 S-formylglutathione hydrolase FrmB [Paenibacillus baekrokdamisoli]BBH19958.1 esterase [Paenibacillus baekrokdamisoli]